MTGQDGAGARTYAYPGYVVARYWWLRYRQRPPAPQVLQFTDSTVTFIWADPRRWPPQTVRV